MAGPKSPGDQYAGAGLSLASPARPNDTPVQTSQPSIASRALALSSYFLSGALCINLSQFLGTPLYLINQDWYNSWIAFTKQSFGLLTMTLTQAFSPTKVIVSGDASVRGQLLRKTDGTLLLDFPERIVLIANHQIYTDWLYLWWTAYCSGMHGRLYIILKESLKKIPILGWGMQFNQFIFLKRNWEKDRGHMAQALQRLNKLADPMWLLLFPEGTNLASSTRKKSAAWAAKNSIKDMRHCLLPRSTGLRFCLQELRETVDYVYDCTIAYEGVPRGAFAQDIFTLKAGYLEGRPPKSVSMYWRRFAIKNIPIDNEKAFELWLLARWREKDLLIENYLIHGQFPGDTGVSKKPSGEIVRGAGHHKVEIRSSHWYEFLQIFAPMGILAMVLYVFYGGLPQKFFESQSGQALKDSAADVKTLKNTAAQVPAPDSFDFDALFDKDKQAQTIGKAGTALAQWMQTPEANRMLSRADLVQRWLQDPQKLLVETFTEDSQKQNFLKTLKEEENRRKRLTNKHQGTFWQDLDNAESKAGSVVKAPTGNFYQDLNKAATARRASSVKQAPAKQINFWNELQKEQSKRTGSINFWDQLAKEENKRTGSVFTLPTISSSSSATAINSLNTGTTAVGNSSASRPPKLSNQKPQKLPSTRSTAVTSGKTPASVKPAANANANAVKKKSVAPPVSKSATTTSTAAKPKAPVTPAKSKAATSSSASKATGTNLVKKPPPKLKSNTTTASVK